MRWIFLLAAILAYPSASAFAAGDKGQDSSGLINEALAQPVKMELNTVLPQALRSIGAKTGVRIEATRAVYALLPWGEQTNINVKLEDQTLGAALGAIAQKLGLEFSIKEQAVELRPVPALLRLGRRSTVEELGALDLLSSNRLNLAKERPTVSELVDAIDARLVELKTDYAVEFRPGSTVKLDATVGVPRNATLAAALESLHKETPATWYPWGVNLVIVPKEDAVRNQLGKTITVRYNNVDVAQVLSELAQEAGVNFDIERGAIQRIPREFRTVKLTLENRTIRQALEDLSGFTGLEFVVNADGVYIWNQQPGQDGGGGQQDPVVGMILLDSGMQLLVRESQVPEDVRGYMKEKISREVESIRKRMAEEGYKPKSPTTKPSAKLDDKDL